MRKAAALGCLLLLAGAAFLPAQERIRRPPPFEPLDIPRLPGLQGHEFPNGLKVWIAPRRPAPFMSLHLIIRGGESASPANQPGLATLAAAVFGLSTETRRPNQVEDAVESVGGSLSVQATPDDIRLSFHFLEENLDDALALIADFLLRPAVTERAVQAAKTSLTYDLLEKERDPEFAARRLIHRKLFQGHPYERFAFPREAIRAWTYKDLSSFLDRIIRPNFSRLLLVGDVNLDMASLKVSHYLNTWPRRDPPPAPVQALRPPAENEVVFIDVPDAKECAVYAGTIVPPLAAADVSALSVLNQIIGGTRYSRLFMSLRETKNAAFYAYSEVEMFRAGGTLLLRALVPPQAIAEAATDLVGEARKLAREPPSVQDVELAKGYLIGRFPVSLERHDAFSERLADVLSLDGENEPWARSPNAVIGVDAERTFALAQRLLAQPFLIVVAGAREACRDGLAEFEAVDLLDAAGRFVSRQTKRKEP